MTQNLRTRGRALAVAVVLAAGTAGCSVTSPFQTTETQSIADGVPVEGPDGTDVDNLALVGGAAGGDTTVTGAVENTGSEAITVTITSGSNEVSTKVGPHRLITLGDEDLTLKNVKEGAGDMAEVEVTIGDESIPVLVPVVAPTGYYEDFAPKGYTAPPTPSETEGGESEGH